MCFLVQARLRKRCRLHFLPLVFTRREEAAKESVQGTAPSDPCFNAKRNLIKDRKLTAAASAAPVLGQLHCLFNLLCSDHAAK
mmetsp:Transcript_73716/g.142576  ORF Transcript_73716/g.142576 Transcript_73716/m.142576 type:complete len:83 (+) Transcript_73716:676-924(+)